MNIEEKKQILCVASRLLGSGRQNTQHKWKSECVMTIAAEPVRKQNHFVYCKNEKIRFSQD